VVAGESVHIDAVAVNTGDRAGEDVVQLYVRDRQASVTRPVLELKSFARVSAEPGERIAIRFQLSTGQLGFYDRHMSFAVEAGSIEVHLGYSSDALMHVGTFTIVNDNNGAEIPKLYTGAVDIRALSFATGTAPR
jgi:beta-glucosidase